MSALQHSLALQRGYVSVWPAALPPALPPGPSHPVVQIPWKTAHLCRLAPPPGIRGKRELYGRGSLVVFAAETVGCIDKSEHLQDVFCWRPTRTRLVYSIDRESAKTGQRTYPEAVRNRALKLSIELISPVCSEPWSARSQVLRLL